MIKLGIDIGQSKIRAETWRPETSSSRSLGSSDGDGFPPYVCFEPLGEERRYGYSPEQLSVRVGAEAWTALTEEEGRKKLAQDRAWFIPSIKGLLLSRYPMSRLFLQKAIEQVKERINSGSEAVIETFVAVPLQADFSYRKALRDCFKSSGLPIKKLYDEPLCLVACSGLLNPHKPSSGKITVVDYGCRNLSLATFILDSVPGDRCDLTLVDYLVESGVGGDFLDKKILADLGRQDQNHHSENVAEQLGRLCLIREKREELARGNGSPVKWRMGHGQKSEYELTSEKVEELMKDLCDQAVRCLQRFLGKSENRNPDMVILSGGLSYHPAIKNCLEGLTDPLKVKWIGSSGAVARGALQLGLRANPRLNYQKRFSIGVGTPTGKFFPFIDQSKLPRNPGEELDYQKMLRLKGEGFPAEGLELDTFLGLSELNTGNIPLARQVIRPDDLAGQLPVSLVFNIGIRKEKDAYQGSLTILPEEKLGGKPDAEEFVFWLD